MSDTKNHKQAIRAIIEAHRTPGKMREIMLQILCDKPSAIVNAWEEVRPSTGNKFGVCGQCENPFETYLFNGACRDCYRAQS